MTTILQQAENKIESGLEAGWDFIKPLLASARTASIADAKTIAIQAVDDLVEDGGALISGTAKATLLPQIMSQALTLVQEAELDLEAIGKELGLAVMAAIEAKASASASASSTASTAS